MSDVYIYMKQIFKASSLESNLASFFVLFDW